MDISTLMKLMTSSASTSALSNSTGLSQEQVTNVLNTIMPSLLSGASAQATNESTAAGFTAALAAHGENDTRDLGKFLGGVDLADGAKIISHLLGGSTQSLVASTASSSGVSKSDVTKLLSTVAPLLMAILGQQNKKHGLASGLMGALVSGAVSNMIGGSSSSNSGLNAGSVLGALGSLLKQ